MRSLLQLPLYCILILSMSATLAEDLNWSVSPLLGIYSPKLAGLNDKEFRAPLPGKGSLVLDAQESQEFLFVIDNPLPSIRFGSHAGVEFQLELDDSYALLFGLGTWEGVSTSLVSSEFPFQGELSKAVYERSGRVSYTQYFVGFKKIIFEEKAKHRTYLRLSLNELMDVDYKEDLTFAFSTGPGAGFKRIITIESQATGIMLMQFGVGSEWYFRDWISLGVEGGLMMELGKSTLGNSRLRSDFQEGDSLDFALPSTLGQDGRIYYLGSDGETYRLIELEMDGWLAQIRLNFYF